MRRLSHSELTTAMTCFARHAFAYTGHLTGGDTLSPIVDAPILVDGRAWGAAVATWHRTGDPWASAVAARDQLGDSVNDEHISALVADYDRVDPNRLSGLTRIEEEIEVPLPARTGSGRASTRWHFQCFIDGYAPHDGRPWLTEFKLRGGLTDPALVMRQRQHRWYAWALRQVGIECAGVLVDERLNAVPKPPRLVKAKRKGEGIDGLTVSHARDQMTTAEAYVEECRQFGVEAHEETVSALRQRLWQQRIPISLRPDELEDAGRELRDSAFLIRELDAGRLAPVRNADRRICAGCRFAPICNDPDDHLHVDSLFTRTVPKRMRDPEEAAA